MAAESNYSLNPLKPYDETILDYFSLYDNMPYEWNMDNDKTLRLVSGNLIKSYRCKIKEPYEIKH